MPFHCWLCQNALINYIISLDLFQLIVGYTVCIYPTSSSYNYCYSIIEMEGRFIKFKIDYKQMRQLFVKVSDVGSLQRLYSQPQNI